jgi:hypothetical protein
MCADTLPSAAAARAFPTRFLQMAQPAQPGCEEGALHSGGGRSHHGGTQHIRQQVGQHR